MLDHVDRKSHELIFMKCVKPRCLHCSTNPIISNQAWEFLKDSDFIWFNPVESGRHEGHFMTFLEMCELSNDQIKSG